MRWRIRFLWTVSALVGVVIRRLCARRRVPGLESGARSIIRVALITRIMMASGAGYLRLRRRRFLLFLVVLSDSPRTDMKKMEYWTSEELRVTLNSVMSRPPEKDRELVRTRGVLVKLRPQEHERWEKRAKAEGIPLSQWVREVGNRASRTG